MLITCFKFDFAYVHVEEMEGKRAEQHQNNGKCYLNTYIPKLIFFSNCWSFLKKNKHKDYKNNIYEDNVFKELKQLMRLSSGYLDSSDLLNMLKKGKD